MPLADVAIKLDRVPSSARHHGGSIDKIHGDHRVARDDVGSGLEICGERVKRPVGNQTHAEIGRSGRAQSQADRKGECKQGMTLYKSSTAFAFRDPQVLSLGSAISNEAIAEFKGLFRVHRNMNRRPIGTGVDALTLVVSGAESLSLSRHPLVGCGRLQMNWASLSQCGRDLHSRIRKGHRARKFQG